MGKINGFRVWDEEFDREHFTPEEIADNDKSYTGIFLKKMLRK